MKASEKCLELIKHFEGCKLEAYLCPAKVWTIGIGTTVYPDGEKVQPGDKISMEYALECLMSDLHLFENTLTGFVKSTITQPQFDALLSLVYNIGPGNFGSSTVLKRVNANPFDPSIDAAFLMWNKAGGRVIDGLTRRRMAEAYLYFNNELKFE